MLKREHCALCDNHKFTLKKGIYCNLTNEKPLFNDICDSIIFDKEARKTIEEVDSKLIVLEKQQTLKKASFATYSLIGFVVVLAIYYFTKYLFELGWVSTFTIFGGLFGLGIIIGAAQNLRKYNVDIKEAQLQKEGIDAIFEHYNVGYETNAKVEKVHGEYEFDYNIKFTS